VYANPWLGDLDRGDGFETKVITRDAVRGDDEEERLKGVELGEVNQECDHVKIK